MKKIKKKIVIQIDGLPFDVIYKELKKEKLPFLGNLLKNGYKLRKITVGLPATTSHFQSELMYSDSSNIPGMMWFSKKKSKFFYMTLESEVREIEKERKCRKPLLMKGASIGNIFSGGARINFTPSFYFGLGTEYFPKGLMLLSLFLLPFVMIFDFIFFIFTPFRKGTFTESFFGEWISRKATLRVLRDVIRKKISPIYVTFMSYDSRSHPFGREHKLTLSTLFKLDKMIEKIFRLAGEDYEIFILSDHGQVDTVLFRDIYGEPLSDKMEDFTQRRVINSNDIKKLLIFKSLDLRKNLSKSKITKRIFSLIYKMGENYYQNKSFKKLPYYKIKRKDIIFVDQGDVAQIYLGENPKEKMVEKDINRFYPGLIRWLFNLKEIYTVSFKVSKKRVEILTKDSLLKRNNNYLSSIRELTAMENSGDIIIFGKRTSKNKVVSFAPDKRSVHGGIEKGEQEAFIVFPKYLNSRIKEPIFPLHIRNIF